MSKIHLGIIGCGWVRDQHMAGIYENAPDVEVVAACDVSKDRLDAFCSRYAVQHAFTHVDDLLSAAVCDAVSIAVKPESLKVELSIQALNAGLHVLAEKPMALTTEEAESMAAAARRSNRVLQIGFNRRFEPVYQEVKRRLATESFGNIVQVHASFLAHSQYPYICLMSQNPHTFDLIQFFGGPVATLQTITRRQIDEDAFYALQAKLGERGEAAYNLREPGLVGIHTSSTLQFESGAVGSFDLSTTAPANRIGGDSFAITSDRGETLVVTRLDNAVHTRADGTESVITAEGWHRKASSFGLEYQHFADVIAGAAPTVVTLEDGLRSVRLYDAYIRSLATVQPVNV